jgi:uncharacterized protein (DUF1697 family)
MKIKTDKTEQIERALAEVNGKAEAFAITTAEQVERIANRCEKALAHIAKSRRIGVIVTHRPAGPSALSYGYSAISTQVEIRRFASGWFLVNISKVSVQPKIKEILRIEISGKQGQEILISQGLTVHDQA